jgi:hypothetical protein
MDQKIQYSVHKEFTTGPCLETDESSHVSFRPIFKSGIHYI